MHYLSPELYPKSFQESEFLSFISSQHLQQHSELYEGLKIMKIHVRKLFSMWERESLLIPRVFAL